MKLFVAVLLMASPSQAHKLSQQQSMMAEIENMSMNANMHKMAVREKTLLKSYLEVDMNEYLQSQMDSSLFNGVDEMQKAKFIGNFFNFVKCRFQDCNLLQTHSRLNMKKKSENPTGAESKVREDKINLDNWGKQGNLVPAHSKTHGAPSLAQTSEPSGPESKAREDDINHLNWGRQGNLTPAHSNDDKAPVLAQTGSSSDKKIESPTAAESKAREDKTNVDNWGKQGNLVPAHSKTHNAPSLAQISEPSGPESKAREDDINHLNWGRQGNLTPAHSNDDKAPVLAQTGSSQDMKPKMVTNSYNEVVADLQKEKDHLLVKPIMLADNKKDAEPIALQTSADVKK